MTKHNPFAFDDKPMPQDIFNRAIEFLFDPDMGQCKGDEGCVYTLKVEGQPDAHCLLGYMLPDTILDLLFEKGWNNSVNILISRKDIAERMPAWLAANGSLIGDLQQIHDDPMKRWLTDKSGFLVDKLNFIAAKYDLKFVDPTLTHWPFGFNADPTGQEIFDRAVRFFTFTEKQAIRDDKGVCLYTTNTGCHCVAGYMLPNTLLSFLGQAALGIDTVAYSDDRGSPNTMSGLTFKGDGTQVPAWVKARNDILKALQGVHDDGDNWRPVKNIERLNHYLGKIAIRFGLQFTPIPVPFEE